MDSSMSRWGDHSVVMRRPLQKRSKTRERKDGNMADTVGPGAAGYSEEGSVEQGQNTAADEA
jgi:hypothetical protein